MRKQVAVENNRILVTLDGAIYTEDADKLRPELLEYIERGYTWFIFDMGNVAYIDSAGIAALLAVNKGVARFGGRVTLQGIQGVVKDLFEITQLGSVFEIVE